MTEKDMVLDILYNINLNILNYSKMITDCYDLNLRQTLQQMRNNEEQFQYELLKIAEQKGYYVKSLPESEENCQVIKLKLTNALAQNQGAGPTPVLK